MFISATDSCCYNSVTESGFREKIRYGRFGNVTIMSRVYIIKAYVPTWFDSVVVYTFIWIGSCRGNVHCKQTGRWDDIVAQWFIIGQVNKEGGIKNVDIMKSCKGAWHKYGIHLE